MNQVTSSLPPAATPYQRLAARGITLPASPAPVANFVSHVIVGNLLFLSGQGPVEAGGVKHTGKVGHDVSIGDAYRHAQLTGVNLLAVIHEALGDLGRVTRVVKLFGMVNAASDFNAQSAGDQWLLGPDGRCVRRHGRACPIRGGFCLAARSDYRRNRGDYRF